jgi:hypothetical protein
VDEGGSVDGVSLSEEAPWGAWGGGASSLGTLEGMLRNLSMRASLLVGDLAVRKPDMWGARLPRIWIDEWRALVVGHLFARGP